MRTFNLTKVCLCASSLLLLGAASATDMLEIQGSMKFLTGAHEIRRDYLLPLALQGKSLRNALEVMIGEGFVCGIKKDMPSVLPPPFDTPAFLACTKDHAQLNDKCEEVIVSILPARSEHPEAEDPLLHKLASTLVEEITPFCPLPYRFSENQLVTLEQKRAAADRQLAVKTEELQLEVTPADAAFTKLLDAGYSCGLDDSGLAAARKSGPSLLCTRRGSKIDGCLREVLRLDVSWRRKEASLKGYFSAMAGAKVRSLAASCDIPSS